MTREQFPVVPGFAMTVNKAQGLTLKEGVVIHLKGSRRFRPAAKHGLPFVAFTRSESFAMTACKGLPPFHDFLEGKKTPMLAMRKDFTEELQRMHTRTMANHSSVTTEQQDNDAYDLWKEAQARKAKRRKGGTTFMPCPCCAEAWGNWLQT